MVTLGLRLEKNVLPWQEDEEPYDKNYTHTESKNIIREFMPEKIQDLNYVF